MKAQYLTITGNTIRKTLISMLALSAIATSASAGTSLENYYENLLTNPDEHVLLAENRGRVTIYDGLDSRLVDSALDSQFDRIDSMMFVRTRVVLADGTEEIDDDCD